MHQRGAASANRSRTSWLQRVRPLRLRSSIASRFESIWSPSSVGAMESADLHFAPSVKMRLHSTDSAHRLLALTGFTELELSKRIRRRSRAGGVLVDVGANAGYFSLLWLATRPENRVIAFEAAPLPRALLRRNLEENGLASRARVDDRAVGSRNGKMAFDPGPPEQSSWGGLAPAGGGRSIEVDVVRLEHAVPPDVEVAVLKIDVEGADAWVLEGAESLLASGRVGIVFFEQNVERMRALGIAAEAPIEILERHEYRVRPLRGTRRTEWMATRNGRYRRQ